MSERGTSKWTTDGDDFVIGNDRPGVSRVTARLSYDEFVAAAAQVGLLVSRASDPPSDPPPVPTAPVDTHDTP